jgi:hypothetical protein
VYGPNQDELFFGDPSSSADLPVWLLTGPSLGLLRQLQRQKIPEKKRGLTSKNWPTAGALAMRWSLVPGHYLRTPVAVSWPLKECLAHPSVERVVQDSCDAYGCAYVRRGAIPDRSCAARAQ